MVAKGTAPTAASTRASVSCAKPITRHPAAIPARAPSRLSSTTTQAPGAAPQAAPQRQAPGRGGLFAEAPRPVAAAPAQVLDTNGAGDAFVAGFLRAHLAGRPLAERLAEGARVAAACVASPELVGDVGPGTPWASAG